VEPRQLRNYVGGKPVDTVSGKTSPIIDPVTEQVIANAPV
jgi:betaine-aldehyde dehydrogenase